MLSEKKLQLGEVFPEGEMRRELDKESPRRSDKEEARQTRVMHLIEELWRDLRYGGRALTKNPGFAVIVVLTLALGIGANTAVFSLVDAFLLRLLPVKDPRQLVIVQSAQLKGGTASTFRYRFFEEFRDGNNSFSGIFACDNAPVSLTVNGQPEIVWGDFVSGNYFDVLGVSAYIGRTFTSDDDRPGSPPIAVISHGYWERRFARDPEVIGETIYLGRLPVTVIGITPPGFFGRNVSGRSVKFGRTSDVIMPMFMQSGLALKDHNAVQIMARLKPGVTPEQAQTDLDVIYQGVLREEPDPKNARQENAEPGDQKIELKPGLRGVSESDDGFAMALRILFAVVGIVLLIACVNVANLLLARAGARQKEIALRLSVGASRGRMIRQLLTESLLLSLLGGALGILFAKWGVRVLLTVVSFSDQGPLAFDLQPDARILAFTGGACLLTGVLFGLAPALSATRLELNEVLKGSGTGGESGLARGRLAKSLVVTQVALSLALLIGAGLLIRSLWQIYEVDTGFEREKVLTMWANPALIGYDHAKELRLYREMLEKLNAIPGAQSASLSRFALTRGGSNIVGPGFFETMGISLLQGRTFSKADEETSPKVAIISESMARKYFTDRDPIGQRLPSDMAQRFGGADTQIVGVVRDTKHYLRQSKWDEAIYVPYTQVPPERLGQVKFLVRVSGNPASIIPAIRQQVRLTDKDLAIENIETQGEELNGFVSQEQSLASLLTFFGALALVLATIGLYGTMSYSVRRRIKEIGIRMALGAQRKNILLMVLRETMLMVAAGVAIGLPVAFVATRLISSMLFEMKVTDPITISMAIAVMLIVGLLAGFIPARRATRVNPMVALRHE